MRPLKCASTSIFFAATALAFSVLTGCKSGESETATAKTSATVNAAVARDPRVQTLADEHARGMEADAKKREEAMKRLGKP